MSIRLFRGRTAVERLSKSALASIFTSTTDRTTGGKRLRRRVLVSPTVSKNLTNLRLEVGAAVHEAASSAIHEARSGALVPTADDLYRSARNRLNKAWVESTEAGLGALAQMAADVP